MTEPEDGGTPVPETPAPGPESTSANPFARLVGVVMSPGETFASIEKKPDWLVPLLIFLALSIASTVLVMPKFDFESAVREQLSRQGTEVDDAQIETMIKIQKPIIYTASVVGIPIVLLIITLVYMLGFKAFGGEGRFAQFFSVSIYAWVPQFFKSVIGTIVAMTRKTIRIEDAETLVMTNLGFLADPLESRAQFALLSSMDIFVFWTLFLMVLGYGTISKRPRGQSIGIVVAIWLVFVIGKTGLALIGQMMSSGA